MSKLIMIVGLVFVLFGCKPYSMVNYQSNNPLKEKIPKMEVYYDKDFISDAMTYGNASGQKFHENLFYEIVDHELDNNIFNELNSNYTIRFTIWEDYYKIKMYGFIPTLVTLGTINIFGVPVGDHRCKIIMRCHILDENLNPVRVYESSGKSRVYCAAYYGYGGGNLSKSAKSGAVFNAFINIKKEIEKESKELLELIEM